MPTFSALTTVMGEARANAIAQSLEQLEPKPVGVGVFEIEDDSGLWEIGAYYLDSPDAGLLDLVAAAFEAKPFALSEVPEIDWVAKVRRELSPVEAGRFYVYGSHDADKVPAVLAQGGRVALQIEATVAFGTGHFRPARVADIGAGTAVLALAAAAVLPDALVIASDIDQVAVDVAVANVAINGLQGRIDCLEAAGFAHPRLQAAAPYDLIFANILKGPLVELAPDMARHTAPGGLIILSGLLVVQAEAITSAYVSQGFTPEAREDLVLKRNQSVS
jgi:ribosomal protein L11 methyltransferase